MATTEAELKTLMVAGLTGDAAAHRMLLDRLSGHLRAYFKGRLARIGRSAQLVARDRVYLPHPPAHASPCLWVQARWPRHARPAALPRAQEHPAHGPVHRTGARPIQGFLEKLTMAGQDPSRRTDDAP